MNNLLPTAENLQRKKVLEYSICKRCNFQIETTLNAVVECKEAKVVWKKVDIWERCKGLLTGGFEGFFNNMMGSRAEKDAERIAVLCWLIWHARNLFLYEQKAESYHQTIAKAGAIISASRDRGVREEQKEGLQHPDNAENAEWLAPPEGFFKLNVDAAVDDCKGQAGLSAVIRNSKGEVIFSSIKCSYFIGDSEFSEAEAMKFGLKVAREKVLQPLVVESDSLNVIKLVNSCIDSRKEIFWVISEIRKMLIDIKDTQITFSCRKTNFIAYRLAKLALKCQKQVIWKDKLSPDLFVIS